MFDFEYSLHLLLATPIFVFCLVNALNGAMWRGRLKTHNNIDFLPAFIWAVTSISGLWLIITVAHILHGKVGKAIGDNLGLTLGLTGLIVTVVTGLTIAAAWRALDDARRAEKMIEAAVNEMKLQTKSLTREGALQNVLALTIKEIRGSSRQSELALYDILSVAVSTEDKKSAFTVYEQIMNDQVYLKIFTSEFSRNGKMEKWLKSLTGDTDLSAEERSIIYALLSQFK